MPNVIISDTSCLIILSKIGKLDLLEKLYGKVYTTPDCTGVWRTNSGMAIDKERSR